MLQWLGLAFQCRGAGSIPSGGDTIPNETENRSNTVTTLIMTLKLVKLFTPWKESYDQPRQHIKKQRHYFVNRGPSSQGYGFSSSHIWI